MTTPSQPAAVLWDFDGTLSDSEPLWAEVQHELLARHGASWSDERMDEFIGAGAYVTAVAMAESMGNGVDPDQLVLDIEDGVADALRAGVPWLEGARELLEEISAAGVPSAIVTATNRRVMEAVFDHLPDEVSFVICGDDVSVGKPDPEGYLMAAERLGVDPRDVVVLEDSVPGSTAGLQAGAVVYAVPAQAELAPHPRMHISSGGLAGVTWDHLKQHWNESRT